MESILVTPSYFYHSCDICGFQCKSGAGLASHKRAHARRGQFTPEDLPVRGPVRFSAAPRPDVPWVAATVPQVASDRQPTHHPARSLFPPTTIGETAVTDVASEAAPAELPARVPASPANPRPIVEEETSARAEPSPSDQKLELVVKPTQAGKTFEMIAGIVGDIRVRGQHQTHFVFAMNTKMNNEQCAKRVVDGVTEHLGEAFTQKVVMLQSGPAPDCGCRAVQTFEELLALPEPPLVVICCSHWKRLNDVYQFLENVKDAQLDPPAWPAERLRSQLGRYFGRYLQLQDYKFILHHDELHHYCSRCNVEVNGMKKKLSVRIQDALAFNPSVLRVCGYTATPEPIFAACGGRENVQLRPLRAERQHMEDYKGSAQMQFCIVEPEPEMHPTEYSKMVLTNHTRAFLYPGAARVFLPASTKVDSHEELRQFVFRLFPNAAVAMLNGREKSLSWFRQDVDVDAVRHDPSVDSWVKWDLQQVRSPDGRPLEVSQKIAEVMLRNELQERPLFITGYLCLGMGQTLMDPRLGNFTHAVLPDRTHMEKMFGSPTPEVLYQEAGRVTGRPDLGLTIVYCPEEIRQNFVREEEKAFAVMQDACIAGALARLQANAGVVGTARMEPAEVQHMTFARTYGRRRAAATLVRNFLPRPLRRWVGYC
ncbi:unnamed protein product [Amoebophrya sp. A120]|nr:unnamed protein product [Amoebophrya sp. A120]|eukprot:GSA120T00003446001.1